MSAQNALNLSRQDITKRKLTREELGEASGGGLYPVWKPYGVEIWLACNYCGQYTELLCVDDGSVKIRIEGEFECPKCGYHFPYNYSNY